VPDVIARLLLAPPGSLVVAYLVVIAAGAVLYVAMSMSTRSPRLATAIAVRRPGWIARRRARSGIRPRKPGAAIGYASATHQVGLSPRELSLGGLILGAPGSGKTYAAAVLIEALAWQGSACVILDPKPSSDLAEVVAGVGGTIWTIDGDRQWDALPADPSELANQLIEVLPVDTRTKVYRDAARLWVLVAGQALQRQREHPAVARMAALCRPGGLATLLKAQGRHIADLPRLSQTEMDGVMSLGTSLSILSRGVASRSLGTDAGALRLENAIGRGQIVLLQMAVGPYPEETRMLGAWALRAMLRLLRHPAPCVLLCDEFARLGVQGRAAIELLSLGREFGKPVVLCTQGPSDFGELGHHALDQAAQDASWILAFRQGTRDSTTASRLLGVRWGEERSWSTGRETREHVRMVEQPYVPASALEDLDPGSAHLRVPSVDGRRTRVEPVRVALPSLVRGVHTVGSPGSPPGATQYRESLASGLPNTKVREDAADVQEPEGEDETSAETAVQVADEDVDDDDYGRIMRRLEEEGERNGECLWWPESGCNDQGYPKVRVGARSEGRRMVTVYKWLYERKQGAVPKGWTLDHTCHTAAKARGECTGGKTCKHRRCCELSHLEAMPHGENTQRRDEPGGGSQTAFVQAETFAIALYAGIDRPSVEQMTVSLNELRQLLSRFEVLADKRRGRCWSPTR
jgi:hypothetical protein